MFFNEKVKDTSSSIIQFLLREKVEILSNLISENSEHLDIDVFYQSNSPSAIFVGTFRAHHSQSSRGALTSILFRLFLHPPPPPSPSVGLACYLFVKNLHFITSTTHRRPNVDKSRLNNLLSLLRPRESFLSSFVLILWNRRIRNLNRQINNTDKSSK